jgi:hypothetical protein
MKNLMLFFLTALVVSLAACTKDDETDNERFTLLTQTVWVSDSLLVNGEDASAPGGMLENFKGEAKFNKDGTGTFGGYTGTWRFLENSTQVKIESPSLLMPITAHIVELTQSSFKVKTDPIGTLVGPVTIRMTFKAK